MPDDMPPDIASLIRQTVRTRVPDSWYSAHAAEVGDDVAVGGSGLGLDSVAIVELLLECEAAVGVPFPAAIFDDGPLTVGRLIAHATLHARTGTG